MYDRFKFTEDNPLRVFNNLFTNEEVEKDTLF